jgi:hypothetical protein
MTMLHRVWQVLRLGLTWMVIWSAIGATLSFVIGIVDPPSIDPGEGPVDVARILGGVGAGSGLIFGLLLTVLERLTRLGDLPFLRAMLWGIVAGAALPLFIGLNDSVLANTIPLGAISGMACVALARARRRWDLFGPRHHHGT